MLCCRMDRFSPINPMNGLVLLARHRRYDGGAADHGHRRAWFATFDDVGLVCILGWRSTAPMVGATAKLFCCAPDNPAEEMR